MARYIPYDYRQSSMVVVNFEDQLRAGTFEHAVHFLVDHKLDLSGFDSSFNNDDGGRPAQAGKGVFQQYRPKGDVRVSQILAEP